jgi:hypothetical protein
MNKLEHFFEILQQSVKDDIFVKLTLSKPLRKKEGLLNVYMRLFIVDGQEVFEFKYRYSTENLYQKFSLETAKLELERLLMECFRTGTLFTLQQDLLVMISKQKLISYRNNAASFKNKLPEILKEVRESEDL